MTKFFRWLSLGPAGVAQLIDTVQTLKAQQVELQSSLRDSVTELRKGYDARALIQESKVAEYERMREEINETYRFLLGNYPKELEMAQISDKHILRLMRELLAGKT